MLPAELYPPIHKDRDLLPIGSKRHGEWAGEVAQHLATMPGTRVPLLPGAHQV